MLLTLGGALVYAQSAAPAAPPAASAETETAPAKTSLTWQEILANGGWLMYVLSAMSVLTVAFIIYFFVVLRVAQVAPRSLLDLLVDGIRNDSLDDARRACEYRPCALSAVSLAALNHVRNMPQPDSSLLRDVIEGEGGRQAESIQGQTQYLLDIAVVAPMVGLLGTVFGMLRAFSGVALDIAQAKPVVLAEGVSQALITTAFGLMVGIPAMAFYAYFRRRAANVVSQLESASADVLTALLSKR
jgi:biopolymer transport protein ExbB